MPTPHFVVLLEGARPCAGSSRHSIAGTTEVFLARGAARAAVRHGGSVTVSVPDPIMSTQHARLFPSDRGWVLEDLGSKNGTFVGAERKDRALLYDGDVIRLGHTVFLYRELPSIAGAPADLDLVPRFPDVVTLVPTFARELDRLVRAARSDLPVLVFGETGSGKEMLARVVHTMSQRKGDLVAVNCGAVPPNLVESTFFGHKRGAFSGAISDELGLVRSADGGTLLLDEIGELPPAAQAALLRVLQEMEVTPVGATRPLKVDVRVVAATHKNLAAQVENESFRADLFARLAGFTLTMPPLRERREDLGLLVGALLGRIAPPRPVVFAPEAGVALARHDWPRNLRELDLCLRRAVALSDDGRITLDHLPSELRGGPPVDDDYREGDPAYDAELRRRLTAALVEHRGNVTLVARALGKARMQIHRWMKRLKLDAASFR